MKKVLITGATGFIGSHLVEENLDRGNRVRALVMPGDPDIGKLEHKKVEVVTGDIRDRDRVKEAARGNEIIFHCAAVVSDWGPKKLYPEVTVGGAENICRAALEAGVSRLVDISTNDVFGRDESVVIDETFPLRKWNEPYPDNKLEAEKILWRYHREEGLPVTMVYPCWVYGPGDRTFVPDLADAILKKDMIYWRKEVIVWPTYVKNVVDLLMVISESEKAVGNGYLIHDGEWVTLQDFCRKIAESLGVPHRETYIPYFAAYGVAWLMEAVWRLLRKKTRPLLTTYVVKNLGSRFRYSIEKAERELGWKPKISYRDGMKVTLEWLNTLDRNALTVK